MSTIALQVENLTKKYGRLTAVQNLNLNVHSGEVFGFLGPNGAGKTTSIHMICGLLKPDNGKIIIQGNTIKDTRHIRNKIGICPQNIIIWPKLTCMEQLQFVAKAYSMPGNDATKRAKFLMKALGFHEKKDKLAQTLSGGMQRRLNLALGLIHNPEILILDEPEAGLDPQSRILVREFIKSQAKNKTIIITTHNMDEADRMADRVAIINRGILLKLDTPGNLKKMIGPGDILEFCTAETFDKNILTEKLASFAKDVRFTRNSILIKARNIVEKIADITSVLKNNGIGIKEIKLRENTLEDVFVHLTGRELRA